MFETHLIPHPSRKNLLPPYEEYKYLLLRNQVWLEGNLEGKISYNDNHHSFNLVPKINSWLRHCLCIHSSHVTCNHYIKTLNLA